MAGGWLFWSVKGEGRRALFAQRTGPAGLAPGPPVALGEVVLEASYTSCRFDLRGTGDDLFLAVVSSAGGCPLLATTSLRPAGWEPLSIRAIENTSIAMSHAGGAGRVAWRVRDMPASKTPPLEEGQIAVLEARVGGPPRVTRCPPVPGMHRLGSGIALLGDQVLAVWLGDGGIMARLGPIAALATRPDWLLAPVDPGVALLRGVHARGRQAIVLLEVTRPRGIHAIRVDADGQATPVLLDL